MTIFHCQPHIYLCGVRMPGGIGQRLLKEGENRGGTSLIDRQRLQRELQTALRPGSTFELPGTATKPKWSNTAGLSFVAILREDEIAPSTSLTIASSRIERRYLSGNSETKELKASLIAIKI
jgi:hypothetical protein